MHIKRPRDITLRDLPNIEAPFAAAPKAAHQARQIGSPLRWDRSMVQDGPFAPTLSDHEAIARLESKLQQGTLVLVHDVTDGKPFSPLVSWQESAHFPGRWQVEKRIAGLNLESHVARLNDWQITPEQISHLGPGGVGHLSASSFDNDLRSREKESQAGAKQDAPNNLELPFGAAAAVAPLVASTADRSGKDKQKKKLHIEMGIFLDGTGNNAGNIEIFQKQVGNVCLKPLHRGEIDEEECRHRLALMMGASYANGETNVSKLFNLYQEGQSERDGRLTRRIRVYSPGVGTTTGAEDSIFSSATGLGDSGILKQVEHAFNELSIRIKTATSDETIDTLTIDLFGFSRGAAAARHAASEIIKGSNGLLAQILRNQNLSLPDSLEIRFVGLFDTVAGIVNLKSGDLFASNERNAPVETYLDPSHVQCAVQLKASDECRETFALNSLRSPDGHLPENFTEIALPGAHSDIGGGYHDEATEKVQLARTLSISGSHTQWPEKTLEWDSLEAKMQETASAGWIGSQSLDVESQNAPYLGIRRSASDHPVPDGTVNLTLEMIRQLRGEYSRIGLRLMHSFAMKADVPIDEIDELDSRLALPDELKAVYESLSAQVEKGEQQLDLPESLKALIKQRYLHHSDNYNSVEFMIGESIAKLEIPWELAMPFVPAENRKRIVHPNSPETA